jgi:chromatin remodeling complex protein RSC6
MAKKVNAALLKPLQPSANLGAIVGTKALPRSQAIKKV